MAKNVFLFIFIISSLFIYNSFEYELRELGKNLSKNCLKNISNHVIFCTKVFNLKIKQMKEDFKQTECCSLWKWKSCLKTYIKEELNQNCNKNDLQFIEEFPQKNSISFIFINNYCKEFPNEDKCHSFPFWLTILLVSIFGSIFLIIIIFLIIYCIRFKYKQKLHLKKFMSKKNELTVVSRL